MGAKFAAGPMPIRYGSPARCRVTSFSYPSVALTMHLAVGSPLISMMHTTACPVGLSVRCSTLFGGTSS